MPVKISSLTNPKIKNIVRLRQRKHRDEAGVTVVDGLKEIGCALKSSVNFVEVYICPPALSAQDGKIIEKLKSGKAEIFETTQDVFDKITYGDRNDGALAVCETPNVSIGSIKPKANGLYLVLEQIEKPGNLGAVLRTADAVGVDGVFVCDPKTDLYNPNVIRSSIGAIFSVPVVKCSNAQAWDFLKRHKVTVAAAIPAAEKNFYTANLKDSTAVVLGSEEQGLTDFWINNADQQVSVPMNGQVDSLNVSVTAAIILYEAHRQRQN